MVVKSSLMPAAAAGLLLALAASGGQNAEETLPTPYTAEEIRDAWTEGLEVWTTVKMQGNEQASVLTVEAWSPDGANICTQLSNAEGERVGEKQCGDSTWEELRMHGSFPASRASRERHRETTPLGDLEGWLYRVEEDNGSVTESFFADSSPGVPALMRRSNGGETFFEMVQTRRVVPGG